MNISIFLLKALSLLLVFASYSNCPAQEKKQNTENKKLKATDLKTKEKLVAYFTDYLAGQSTNFDNPATVKSSEITQKQYLVWEAWKEANHNFSEQKLPALESLSEGKSASWELPANLESNAVMPFYWGYKGETQPQNGYPLYIYTHGSGDKAAEWATGLKICQKFDDAPSVYFIPQIPNMGENYRWWQKSKQFAWEKLIRLALISGNVDPDHIYFFGISEGGYGSQRLASFYADYMAAAGPMAGGEPLKNAPAENCRNIAFSLLTGANDMGFYRNKLTQYTKDEFNRLEQLCPGSFTHRIELIPGMGHGIDYKLTTPWLKQYTRNPYPKSIMWENFEMDGLYREGFYNLYIKERSNGNTDTRSFYEMAINGNDITLKVDEVTYKATEIDPRWGIELKFEKSHKPATMGKVVIYLCQELIDLNKKVSLTVNGKKVFEGTVKPQLSHMVNSCATFFDPKRIYPAAIEVDLSQL